MSPRAQAVLIGGAFLGVLSALPVISLANVCCTWLIGGGLVTAYLLQQAQPQPLTLRDGAVGGCLAGVCGAFIYTLVSLPIQLLLAPMRRRMGDLIGGDPSLPREVAELIEELSRSSAVLAVLGFVVMLSFGVAFATLGGVIGAVIFRPGAATPAAGPPPPGHGLTGP